MNTDAPGWVYFAIADTTGLVKVGYTRNPRKRFKGLRSEAKSPIRVLRKLRTPFPVVDEEFIHDELRAKLVHGEWFKLDLADIARASRAFYRLMKIRRKRGYLPTGWRRSA